MVSYFSPTKGDRDLKIVKPAESVAPARTMDRAGADQVSVLGRGMHIVGNIVCTGAVQIHGQVEGDIHASQVVLCEGASAQGRIVAQDAVIQGTFNGTVHGNTVKLARSAVVDGEIFNRSLTIETDAHFEGVSRRLDKAVEPPNPQSLARKAEAPLALEASQIVAPATQPVAAEPVATQPAYVQSAQQQPVHTMSKSDILARAEALLAGHPAK